MTEQAQCYAVSLAKSLIIVVSLLDTLVCFSVIQSEVVKQNQVLSRDIYLWINAYYKPSNVDQEQPS